MRASPLVALIALGSTVPALAGVIGTTGAAVSVSAPPSVALGAFESNSDVPIFFESSGTLALGVQVEITGPGLFDAPGDLTLATVPAGTAYESYLLRSDPVGGASRVYEGSVTFDQDVIGIIVGRSLLLASDSILGAPGTTYTDYAARGLELSANADRLQLSLNSRTVAFRFTTSTSSDDIRIITVPGPGSAALMLMGVLAASRRRRA